MSFWNSSCAMLAVAPQYTFCYENSEMHEGILERNMLMTFYTKLLAAAADLMLTAAQLSLR